MTDSFEGASGRSTRDAGTTRCGVALVGAGRMGREHLRAFADVPGVQLVGIHSRTRSRAETLAAECRVKAVFDSVRALYDATAAELVVVTVPELSMTNVSVECFDYPWTVLLEKPAGFNLAEAETIHTAAIKRGRRVVVGLNRRFYSSTRMALADLAETSGPRFIRVADQQGMAAAAAAGHPQDVVDHWMYANSIHLVDLLRTFGRGGITSVKPVFPWRRRGANRVVLAAVEFDSGDCGIYEGIWDGPGPWAVEVTAAERRWELRPLEEATVQQRGERTRTSVPSGVFDQLFKPGLRLQAAECVRTALGEPSCAVALEDSLESMRLVHAIFNT